jgi:hypothetical protein
MMGDFNITEEPINCAPARYDNESAIEALKDLRTILNLNNIGLDNTMTVSLTRRAASVSYNCREVRFRSTYKK